MSSHPVVEFRKLVADSGFIDKTFEAYVRRWFNLYMPSFPLGLLDTNPERWEIDPDAVHEVKEIIWKRRTCSECEEVLADEQQVCCTEEQEDGNENPVSVVESEMSVWVVKNSSTGEYVSNTRYVRNAQTGEDHDDVPVDGESVYGWDDEADALEAASNLDNEYHAEYFHENCYGFPWAHSWAFLPDRWVQNGSLSAAGFRVATYTGGSGERHDETFRLAGIDGGGYDMLSSNWARLVAYHTISRDISVDTDNGPAIITMDYRADLEKLSDSLQEVNS